MLDRIQEIDTGAIEELTRIKRDQEVLEDRLRLMQERREGVSEVVFERVRSDYRGRLDSLDAEARPLKDRARTEYAKLQALRSEIQHARDEARLEKEEVEFRNGLGEFPAGEYDRRAAECAERLTAREGELAEVEALRERFLGACRSPDELEGPPPTAPPAPAEARPTPEPPAAAAAEAAEEEPVPDVTTISPVPVDGSPAVEEPFAEPPREEPDLGDADAVEPLLADQEAVAASLPPPPAESPFDVGPTSRFEPASEDGDADSTVLDQPRGDDLEATGTANRRRREDEWHEAPTGEFEVPPPTMPTAVTAVDEDLEDHEVSEATRILSRPRLVEMENGASGREHPLALGRTSIGRASDNVVHLLDEAVSRHHAEVVPGPDGYLLRDLGSENGIFVNGERSPEHVLREGDVIQIGARTLVFHGA
jgi:hypothetical protein